MSRRHLVNGPEDVVPEALEGLALTHPGLVRYEPEAALVVRRHLVPREGRAGVRRRVRARTAARRVRGRRDARRRRGRRGVRVATALQIHAGTTTADSGAGVLQVVKNYTGDVLNFTIAGEIAADEGVDVATVLVDDDLATAGSKVGRRGTAAVVAVEKVCGAAAEAGADLATLAALGRAGGGVVPVPGPGPRGGRAPAASRNRRSSCRTTSSSSASASTGNVAPVASPSPRPTTSSTGSSRPSSPTSAWTARTRSSRSSTGSGGMYPLQLFVAARRTHQRLGARGITVARSLVGSYVTSLDMNGLSITLVRADEELLRLWDAPVRTPALTW